MLTDSSHNYVSSIYAIKTINPRVSKYLEKLHFLYTEHILRKPIDNKEILLSCKDVLRCPHKHVNRLLSIIIFHLLIKIKIDVGAIY